MVLVARALSLLMIVAVVLSGCATQKSGTSTTTSSSATLAGTPGSVATGNGTGSPAAARAANNTTPTITFLASVKQGPVPVRVNFTLTASDADKDNLTWSFDADGDHKAEAHGNQTDFTRKLAFNYTAAKTYNATFTVTDGRSPAIVRTIAINATAAASGAVDHRACKGVMGTNPVGLTVNNGDNSVGGCSLGSITAPMTVKALEAVSGCSHDVSPTGSSTGYGTANGVGKSWPAGAAFRVVCSAGTVSLSGSIDFVPT